MERQRVPGAGSGFGLCFAVRTKELASEPGSVGEYRWDGVGGTFFWVDPERQIGVVLLMQVLPFFDDACKRVVSGFEERLYKVL